VREYDLYILLADVSSGLDMKVCVRCRSRPAILGHQCRGLQGDWSHPNGESLAMLLQHNTARWTYIAEGKMRDGWVRRFPVLDPNGRLEGVISLADLARATAGETGDHDLSESQVGEKLTAICISSGQTMSAG
jgi:hypothetical protein